MTDSNDILSINRERWNALVENGNRWTIPVTSEQVANARNGDWQIVLTPTKPVPRDWFPPLDERRFDLLCLAGAGGQQGPLLAAAGANVTVLDNSDAQLGQDRAVAERDGLDIKTIQGDMRDLSCLDDCTFDLIVHPCSNCFVPDIHPVWRECFRVLRPGGSLITGFTNPLRFIFDDELLEKGELKVAHKMPYSDLTSLSAEQRQRFADQNEPLIFGHSLADQIGGQLKGRFLARRVLRRLVRTGTRRLVAIYRVVYCYSGDQGLIPQRLFDGSSRDFIDQKSGHLGSAACKNRQDTQNNPARPFRLSG